MSEIEIIEAIARCYKDNNISLFILDITPELSQESLREIKLSVDNISTSIIVFDEFNDVEIQNPILWLHLIIDACEGFEEAKDYHEWRLNEGFHDTAFFQSLYQQYTLLVPEIRKIIGHAVKAVDSHHIEFNTNIAIALREYHL
jgi:hypothetical protein